MCAPRVRHTTCALLLAVALVPLGGSAVLACSGPGAARAMGESELIGWSFAGVAIAVVAAGCKLLRRRVPGYRIRWIVAPLALHPRWWMSSVHGDCGYGLRWWSLVGTVWIALVVGLAICRPRSTEARSRKWRWALSGALAGALPGVLIAAILVERPGWVTSDVMVPLAASVLVSMVIAGAVVGGGVFELKVGDGRRLRFCIRALLVLVVLTPLFVAVLPVIPYQGAFSIPFHFVVVDDATGRPIPNAVIRLIHPAFAENDRENQHEKMVTEVDGSVECYLDGTSHGREGLLGRTETITFNPWMIRVEAQGYRPFFTSLASDPPVPADRFTAPPLGLADPLPPSATIRLTPIGAGGTKRSSEQRSRASTLPRTGPG